LNLHPYDGVERRFRHTDADPETGLALVAKLLSIEVPIEVRREALYNLSFYSGVVGVVDHLAITIPADPGVWQEVVDKLQLRTPQQASEDASWADDFAWLVCSDAVEFLNSERQPFQDPCEASGRIYFQQSSDVNHWIAVWGCDQRLHYLSYDQG
jgi:hypothetical protein